MTALRRQQLVRLSGDGWARVLAAPRDAGARACLDVWAARGLPLVITRQPPSGDDRVATGLPAPARFGRRRLALAIELRDVLFFDEFPQAEATTRLLPRTLAPAWRALLASLAAVDCAPRVYGGYGWQALTRLAYVHADSDLDLLLPVASAAQADQVARVLARADGSLPHAAPHSGVRSLLLHATSETDGVRSLFLHGSSSEASTDATQEERPDPALPDDGGHRARVGDASISGHDARCESSRGEMQKERPDPNCSGICVQKERPDPRSRASPAGSGSTWPGPRLDGELLFPDGAAIAWREWVAHRDGRVAQVLVKRLRGVALESAGVGAP